MAMPPQVKMSARLLRNSAKAPERSRRAMRVTGRIRPSKGLSSTSAVARRRTRVPT